ncbi:MAG: 50S ribosomal protein L28 [Sphaerochaetaceae bacterium]
MARRCEICGKGTVAGNNVPRKGQAKKKGGVGQHIGVTTKRVFRPNIISVKAMVDGRPQTIKVCARCLRAGKVQKIVSQKSEV